MKTIVKIFAAAAVAALCCLTACDKHTPYRHNNTSGTEHQGGNNPGGGGNTTIKAKLRTDWVLEYKGREDYTEDNGSVSRVERFHIEAPGAAYYLVRTINPDVFQENYGTDVLKFFQDEQGYLEQDAKTFNEKVTDYLYNQSPQDLLFDMIRHGDWQGYLIGFDANGKITGEYTKCEFKVVEDKPKDAFKRWLGFWTVSGPDPDGRLVSYNIEVVSSEANYSYIVYDWETGDSITDGGTEMNGSEDWIETFFWDGNMYFTSQYIQTYQVSGTTYDQFFFGNFNYNGHHTVNGQGFEAGEYIIPEEGLDIAAAQMVEIDNSKAEILGCEIIAYMSDDDMTGYKTHFSSMQYFADDGKELRKFNFNVPQFPLTMTKTGASPTSVRTVARKPATIKTTASKRALKQHTRLRDVQRKDSHAAQQAVAKKAAEGTVK